MTSEKPTSSDSSIEEIIDHQERHNENTSTGGSGGGVGRCYECAFCKRGFTNAQALGGHMNIHRKDKAKAKKKIQELSLLVNTKSHEDFKPHKNSSMASSNRFLHNSGFLTCKNYQPYYSIPNPNYLQTCKQFDLFSHEKDHHLSMHGYRFMDQNLKLGIGLPLGEDGKERKSDGMNGDLDLELRLGQHP